MDTVTPLATVAAAGAGEVGMGTKGRGLPARDRAAWVLEPQRLWLAVPPKQREQGINTPASLFPLFLIG